MKNLKIPFRQSHHITGSIVKMAEDCGKQLHQLKLSDLQKIEKKITKDIFNFLDVQSSVNSRTSYGGTSPLMVKKQITDAQKYLKSPFHRGIPYTYERKLENRKTKKRNSEY